MDFRSYDINNKIPLVTIGVLSFNYSKYLLEALDSLLAQTYKNIELIIIDDCSTDNAVDIIQTWIKQNKIHCVFIKNEYNQGITRVSNKLVGIAKGKYINLFATDDIMLPRKIEEQVSKLEAAGEEYGMCYANAQTIDENGSRLGFYINEENVSLPEGDVLEQFVTNKMVFATPVALIRMSTYKTCGLYDERVLIEDYNFWLRFFACFKACVCDYPSLIYRVKQHSGIFNEWNKNNKERYYHDRILSNHDALKFINNPSVKNYLHNKINQYLNALSINQSPFTRRLIWYLIRNGYYKIPSKILFREGMYCFSSRKKLAING